MLLTLDIAFRNTGWVILNKGVIQSYGTIVTKKDPRKQVKISDDYASNCTQLAAQLNAIIWSYRPKGILAELPHGSQNARAAKMLGGAVGIVAAIAVCHNLPLELISEGDSKQAALGKKSAAKEEAMDWARKKYPNIDFGNIKAKFEHVADALMAYNGLSNNILIRTFG